VTSCGSSTSSRRMQLSSPGMAGEASAIERTVADLREVPNRRPHASIRLEEEVISSGLIQVKLVSESSNSSCASREASQR